MGASTIAGLWKAQNGKCFYCGGHTWFGKCKNRKSGESRERAKERLGIKAGESGAKRQMRFSRATVEHLKRVADGGKTKGNIVMACAYCNSYRGETTPDQHRADMMWRVYAGLHPVNRGDAANVTKQVENE